VAGEVAQVCLDYVEAAGSGRVGRRPAQHAHRAGVVPARAIDELPGDRVGRTAGHHQRGAAHLRLAVARVDPYGVQLEQLTAEVLVRRLLGRHVVIEVVQHRLVQAAGNQQVGEAAQCVRPDHVGVEAVTAVPDVAGRAGDVEVVRPELDHHLLQLAPAPGRPQQRRLAQGPASRPRSPQRARRAPGRWSGPAGDSGRDSRRRPSRRWRPAAAAGSANRPHPAAAPRPPAPESTRTSSGAAGAAAGRPPAGSPRRPAQHRVRVRWRRLRHRPRPGRGGGAG